MNARSTHLDRLLAAAAAAAFAGPALGLTVLSDGFGDADRNNDGMIDQFDWDLNEGGVLNDINQADPADRGYQPPAFPEAPLVPEIGVATDVSDTGIRWQGGGGFTSTANADTGLFAGKIYSRIVDDSAGVFPEGAAIDDGLALGLNSKGRGTTLMGFFGQNVALGNNVGDQVKVSFDMRLWQSSPNSNPQILPERGDLRFGLFQDTDNEIGQTNSFAGPFDGGLPTSAVWGEEDGSLDGQLSGPGARGDAGWAARIKLFDTYPADGADGPAANGSLTGPRIFEETNTDPDGISSQRFRLLQGSDDDFVAKPDELNPNFTTLVNGKVYNLALVLERTASSILATFEVDNLTDGTSFSFGGEESLNDGAEDPGSGGIQSDDWDYFAIRVSSANSFGEQDYDMIIDNFLLETFEGAAEILGDYNDNGLVEQGDLNQVLNNWGTDFASVSASWINQRPTEGIVDQAELNVVLNRWGSDAAPDFSGSSVPEPASLALLGLGALALRRRIG